MRSYGCLLVMSLAIGLLLVAVPAAMAQNAARAPGGQVPASFGAIAYDWRTGQVGHARGDPTREAAEQEALRTCGQAQCVVRVRFNHACGVVATGEHSAVIGLARDDERVAQDDALARCTALGGKNCRIVDSLCSR